MNGGLYMKGNDLLNNVLKEIQSYYKKECVALGESTEKEQVLKMYIEVLTELIISIQKSLQILSLSCDLNQLKTQCLQEAFEEEVEQLVDAFYELLEQRFNKLKLKKVYEELDTHVAALDDLIEDFNDINTEAPVPYIEQWNIDFFFENE